MTCATYLREQGVPYPRTCADCGLGPCRVYPSTTKNIGAVLAQAAALPKMPPSPTDDELREVWREAGGEFHGPNVETGTMPEAQLLPFLRKLWNGERP